MNSDIPILGHRTLEHWILTWLYLVMGDWNTRLCNCYVGTQNTRILGCEIAMLGHRTLEYWFVILQYWNKGNSHTGI